MQAPSEKHLEDYLWKHPEALGVLDYPPHLQDVPIFDLQYRQMRIPSGIVDLVGCDFRITVFELKKGVLDAEALTQLMRYMHDLNLMISIALSELSKSEAWLQWNRGCRDDSLIRGVLIGNSVSDRNLPIACEGCGVDIITYDFSDGVYTFSDLPRDFGYVSLDYMRKINLSVTNNGIIDFVAGVFQDEVERTSETLFDAADAANQHINNLDGDS